MVKSLFIHLLHLFYLKRNETATTTKNAVQKLISDTFGNIFGIVAFQSIMMINATNIFLIIHHNAAMSNVMNTVPIPTLATFAATLAAVNAVNGFIMDDGAAAVIPCGTVHNRVVGFAVVVAMFGYVILECVVQFISAIENVQGTIM
jgi:hypothetical protein